MAGKPKDMSVVKQLLISYQSGTGIKKIARDLGISKNTVKSYIKKVKVSGLNIKELLLYESPVLESKLFAGNPAYKEDRYQILKEYLSTYAKELNRVGVNKTVLWQEYREQHPRGYGHSQFHFHVNQFLKAQKPSMVLHHDPGDKLYVDFAGKKLSYIDPNTGEIIWCQVFVGSLPFSDYGFAMAVPSQGTSDFLNALQCCLQHLGGVPKTLVPDNLKSAVIKANNYEPEINKALSDLAVHYGTTVTPTRARKPKDKALVENHVKIIYSRVYAKIRDQQFFSLSDLNQAIAERMLDHNQTRMQKKAYCREECFLAHEKTILSTLPVEPFELKYYRSLKVAQNNHIYLSIDNRHYSVPYQHIGFASKVIYTRNLVNIYINGEQVASHRRVRARGYSTIKEHLCSQHQHYLKRSPDYYLSRAEGKKWLYLFIQLVFNQKKKYPEQLYKLCDGIFSLAKKTPEEAFNQAIKMALEQQIPSYSFVRNILTNKTYQNHTDTPVSTKLPDHKNTRGKNYYS